MGVSGKSLGLEREAVRLAIGVARFADRGAVEEIAGIELHAGLVGEQFEDPAAGGILDPRHQMEIAGRRAGDDIIVVIALAEADLRVAPVADAGADRRGGAEIERRAGDAAELAGRDQGRRRPG